ncbi:MAG: hypothetical protein GF353_13845 [Candidatus Lokiarchaeota archaeon]|nr:hypothetical protein [Candidatus Lokiarchaeota archaeon]
MNREYLASYHNQGAPRKNNYSEIQLLAKDLGNQHKDNSKRRHKEIIFSKYTNSPYSQWIDNKIKPILIELNLFIPDLTSANFIPHSIFFQICFTLNKPFISRDDESLHICDNAVKKDKVFKLPMISPSSWKGSLRSAMVRKLVLQHRTTLEFTEQRFRLFLLFGDEKGDEINRKSTSEFLDVAKPESAALYRSTKKKLFIPMDGEELPNHKGRLFFFPTFFTKTSAEIINPHDRKSGTGTVPIYLETVPIDTKGTFTLLYFPFDRIGREEKDEKNGLDKTLEEEMKVDLIEISKGLNSMFTKYGFGAKTSSGFGTAEIKTDSIVIQANDNGDLRDEISKAKELLGRKEGENE